MQALRHVIVPVLAETVLKTWANLVFEMVLDLYVKSGSGWEINGWESHSSGCHSTRLVNQGTLGLISADQSELGGLSPWFPAVPSVDSDNAHVFAFQ